MFKQLIYSLHKKAQHSDFLLRTNEKKIAIANKRILSATSLTSVLIFAVLFVLSLILDTFKVLRVVYCTMALANCVVFLAFRRQTNPKKIILGLYLYFILLYFLMLYLSVFQSADSMAASFISLLILFPLFIIDIEIRKTVVLVLMYALHLIFSAISKNFSLFLDDCINTTVFMLIGLFMGHYFQNVIINNFEMKRNSKNRQNIDFLTGLYNRRMMYQTMFKSENSEDTPKITGIVMIDIDNFKKYNDTYGHVTGDRCLRKLSDCFKIFADKKDIEFFRYGGEEFLAFSFGHSYDELLSLANSLCEQVQALHIPHKLNVTGFVTISIGIAEFKKSKLSGCNNLIAAADKALYAAKSEGRNRVMGYMSNFNII